MECEVEEVEGRKGPEGVEGDRREMIKKRGGTWWRLYCMNWYNGTH